MAYPLYYLQELKYTFNVCVQTHKIIPMSNLNYKLFSSFLSSHLESITLIARRYLETFRYIV